MRTWTKTYLWSFILLVLPGGLGKEWEVRYPAGGQICAPRGSNVIIPCSYTYPRTRYKVKNLVWCRNHLICQRPTPFVYNSSSNRGIARYKYLGDFISNCTLQIQGIRPEDYKVHRFRIEAEGEQHTGQSGVNVVLMTMMLTDAGARRAAVVKAGEGVTLTCTAPCPFHQSISWYRDDHPLPETSPTLQLESLTEAHSGNYSCALNTYGSVTRSNSYNLSVEGPGEIPESLTESPSSTYMITGVVIGVLLAVVTIVVVALLIIKRRRAEVQNKENRDSVRVPAVDPVYSNIGEPVPQTADREDISYATVQFQHKTPHGPAHQHREDPVIYSAVARGQ